MKWVKEHSNQSASRKVRNREKCDDTLPWYWVIHKAIGQSITKLLCHSVRLSTVVLSSAIKKVKSSILKYCWRGFNKRATPKETSLLHTDFHGPWVIAFTGCSGDYCWSAVVLVLCAYCFQLSVIKSFDVRTLTQLQQIRYCYKSYHHQRLLAFNFIPFDYEIFDINLTRGKTIACSWASFNSNQQFVYSGVCFCGFDLCIEKWSNEKYEVFYSNI